jgi:signal transduction histidine kinase
MAKILRLSIINAGNPFDNYQGQIRQDLFCYKLLKNIPIRFIVFSFLIFTNLGLGIAQNSKIDALKQQLAKAKDDTTKIDILYQLGFEYWDYDFEIALEYSNECLSLAKKLNNPRGLAKAYTNQGLYYYFKGDYVEAMKRYRLAINALEGKQYSDFPAYTLTRIGNIYRVQSNFDSALFYYNLSKVSIVGNPSNIALSSIFYNTGIVQIQQEIFDSALINISKSLEIRKQLDQPLLVAESIKEIGSIYLEINEYDSAQKYFNEMSQIAIQYDAIEAKIFSAIYMGDLSFRKGDFSGAVDQLKESWGLLIKHDFVRLKIVNLFVMGQVYSESGEYEQALEHLFEAFKLNKPLNNLKQEADINYELGRVYFRQNNPTAKKIVLKSRTQYEELGLNLSAALANNLLGNINLIANEYDSALYYFNQALTTNRKAKNDKGIAASLFNISLVYMKNGSLNRALIYQIESLEIEQKIGNKLGEIISYNSLGQLYQALGNFKKAESCLLKANELLQKTPSLYHQEENLRFFAELYAATSNYQKAVGYYQAAKLLSDSLYSQEMASKSLKLSSLHELKEKENEIKLLNNDKVTQNNELGLQKSQLQQQRLFIVFTTVVIVFFIVFSLLLARALKKVKLTQNKLVASEKRASLGVLVSGLSHEINNPLNYIRGGVNYFKEHFTATNEEQVQMLNVIDEGVKRTSHILKVLSQFERLQPYEYAECDLMNIIQESISFLKEEIGQEIEISIPVVEKPVLLLGHKDQLTQVFVEIIRNSLEAIKKEPGKINIEYESDNKTNIIAITDTGQGIKPQDHLKIEDPFFTTKEQGKGLGLYISNYIMNEHKGSISYTTVAKQGTKVTLLFPKL